MTLYAVISNGEVREFRHFAEAPEGLDARPVIDEPPAYDPATQIRVPSGYSIEPTIVRRGYLVAPRPPLYVPDVVTNAQCRVVLIRQGINPDDVLAYINTSEGLSEPVRQELKARWEYANHIYRHDPATIQLGAILGFSAEQLDALFIAAAALP